MHGGTSNDARRSPSDSITEDVPCAACGYNLRGLTPGLNCPECGHAIESSLRSWLESPITTHAARKFAAGITLLELAAITSFCTLLIPIGNPFDGPRRVVMWQEIAKLAVGLFPHVAGWWGAWVLTRGSIAPRRLSHAWKPGRWMIRASATVGVLFIPAMFAANVLIGFRPRLGSVTLPMLTGLATLATLLIYTYLSRVVALMNRRALSWSCKVLAALVAVSTLWSWVRGLAEGIPLFLPVPFVMTPVIGSGYPVAVRWPWYWLKYSKTPLPSWSAPVLAVCVAAILSVLLLEALRRTFSRAIKQANDRGNTAASSPP